MRVKWLVWSLWTLWVVGVALAAGYLLTPSPLSGHLAEGFLAYSAIVFFTFWLWGVGGAILVDMFD